MILSIGPMPVNEKSKSDADELQKQLGIPVVVISGIFEEIDKTYDLLGEIYGEKERAKELSEYCLNTLKNVDEKLKDVQEDEMKKVYYAEGNDGLSTEPVGSGHSVVLEHTKAKNVANIEAKPGSGMTPVSIEQIIDWNPELIISWSDKKGGAFSAIKEDPLWTGIDAIKNNEVYTTPDHPFTWIDRPPSVNRFLGLQWLANLLYPEKYDIDLVKTTQEFCKKFYNIDLSENDAKEILSTSIRN